MKKTSLYAYISFTGKDDSKDFPLKEVTKSLEVQPTEKWKVGDKGKYIRSLQYTCWKYESETIETLDVDYVLLPILNVFQDKTDSINRIKEELNLNVQIELVITMIDGYAPGLVISPEFSRFASAINAFIDIDMYIYPFSEPEE